MDKRYPIAPNGIFTTFQGEGILLGVPMIFVRLAGCSVGCLGCDTNYTVADRMYPIEIFDQVMLQKWDEEDKRKHSTVEWIWITGGEPTDHDIAPLVKGFHELGFKVALATAGVRYVKWAPEGIDVHVRADEYAVDFLSVSTHYLDNRWVQRTGDQLNIVPGLNDLSLKHLEDIDVSGFAHRYITPYDGDTASKYECMEWVRRHSGWRLGIQAHKEWSVP